MTNIEAIETVRILFNARINELCNQSRFSDAEELETVRDMAISALEKQEGKKPIIVETNIYDTEEIHHGCTVQILSNSVTGDVSVGWWREKEDT